MDRRRYFIDLEFWERGNDWPIVPISIGVVPEEGRSLYLINGHIPMEEIWRDPWMRDNVLSHLPITVYGDQRDAEGIPRLGWNEDSHVYDQCVFTPGQMAVQLEEFLSVGQYFDADQPPVELWADWSAYDHVVLAQLWGSMMKLPRGMPMRTHCTQQLLDDWGLRDEWEGLAASLQAAWGKEDQMHNALVDASWCKEVWSWANRMRAS